MRQFTREEIELAQTLRSIFGKIGSSMIADELQHKLNEKAKMRLLGDLAVPTVRTLADAFGLDASPKIKRMPKEKLLKLFDGVDLDDVLLALSVGTLPKM